MNKNNSNYLPDEGIYKKYQHEETSDIFSRAAVFAEFVKDARKLILYRYCLARIINKKLLAGTVGLPKANIKLTSPLMIQIAKLAVLVSFRIRQFILMP